MNDQIYPRHIGFSGTRHSMTNRQFGAFLHTFRNIFQHSYAHNQAVTLHHGDCLGADAHAHSQFVAWRNLLPDKSKRELYHIVIHPPDKEKLRAHCEIDSELDFVLPVEPYLDRNLAILAQCQTIICVPAEQNPRPRGGTWHVFRHAVQMGKDTIVIQPDGRFRVFQPPPL